MGVTSQVHYHVISRNSQTFFHDREEAGREANEDSPVIEGPFPNPHLTEAQKQTSYKIDLEESKGTIEDYKKYKGL